MAFPKYVFKRGTGKQVNESGLFTAESLLVASAEELAALGPGWCESPAEAGAASTLEKHEEKPARHVEHRVHPSPVDAHEESAAEKHHKKVK